MSHHHCSERRTRRASSHIAATGSTSRRRSLAAIAVLAAIHGAVVCEFVWHINQGDVVEVAVVDCVESFTDPTSSLLGAAVPVGVAASAGIAAGTLGRKLGGPSAGYVTTAQ
jgi:hypothetical protein